MSMQWHKIILSNFSLELKDQTVSSYQGCISSASVGKWIGYFPLERQWWQGGKEKKRKKKKRIGLLQFQWVDFLRGESFWSLSYPVLLQPESQVSRFRVHIPRQAEAWQPQGDWIPRQAEAGRPPGTPGLVDPWTGWGMTTFRGPGP